MLQDLKSVRFLSSPTKNKLENSIMDESPLDLIKKIERRDGTDF